LGRQNNAILQQVPDMQPLLFFSRVAFICNICFLLTISFHFLPAVPDSHFYSTILVLGFVVAIVLNIMVNLIIIVLVLLRKPLRPRFPKWLIIANAVILVPQLIYFLT
jgi:hypothetical protein